MPVKKLLTMAALLASLSMSAPAMAAPVGATPEAQARGLILIPLTLTKLEDLYFGTIIPSNMSGVVTVPADGAAAFASGGVTLVNSDPAFPARFAGAGSAGQQVFLTATNPVSLTNSLGDTVTVLALTLDKLPIQTIDATRAFYFNVGGVLHVEANQPEGVYEAEFDVTASYL